MGCAVEEYAAAGQGEIRYVKIWGNNGFLDGMGISLLGINLYLPYGSGGM